MGTYSEAIDHLKGAGLRPTRQRLSLARLLFADGHRHVSAEELFQEARNADIQVSLATIYNTLHQFTDAGLLREVPVDSGQSYFDTNVDHHHHFFVPETGEVMDIDSEAIGLDDAPPPPDGYAVERVDVVVRLRKVD
ncbi:MAG: transcriptional repressor [Alphaproteobacteria bacterium]|jgi:Fur family iron response transcriptional regulator|nr:transcriptional repressor [Alphaproteobacteria bacterium]